MGELVAKKYPTKLFLKAADHTYVECGNGGKAWGCWGGKSGGNGFNKGTGSTKRADCIAQPDEKAGIKRYLINGVCHQAANRVLVPAGILVTGARGYSVSSAIFGAYGRPSDFNRYPDVTGDLPECVCAEAAMGVKGSSALSAEENNYIQDIQKAYMKFESSVATPLETMSFHCSLFDREIAFRLGDVEEKISKGLRVAKQKSEFTFSYLVDSLDKEKMDPAEFIKSFNLMTIEFQDDLANTLNADFFKKLMDHDREERVILADPDIIKELYGEKVVKEVYNNM